MKTEQLKRKLNRIILDLKDFADEPCLDDRSKSETNEAIELLESICPYSTEL